MKHSVDMVELKSKIQDTFMLKDVTFPQYNLDDDGLHLVWGRNNEIVHVNIYNHEAVNSIFDIRLCGYYSTSSTGMVFFEHGLFEVEENEEIKSAILEIMGADSEEGILQLLYNVEDLSPEITRAVNDNFFKMLEGETEYLDLEELEKKGLVSNIAYIN